MTFGNWVAAFRSLYPSIDVPLYTDDDWRSWTDQLQLAAPDTIWPDDRQYNDWQGWAAEVMQILS